MSESTLVPVLPGSPWLDRIWGLYRKHSNTLGFLPRGALDEFAHAGCVYAATRGEELLGYIAWRRSRMESVLVHLCVADDHRGKDCSEVLLRGMIEACRDDAAIRLHCRKDYAAANRLWPRHGFAVLGEKSGRGSDGATLLIWKRTNPDAPQYELGFEEKREAAHTVAIDANIFFDLMQPDAVHHEESSALLADWLEDVDIAVTRELRNEVARQEDKDRRQNSARFLHRFKELATHPDELNAAYSAIAEVLPPATSDSDHSDRRQLTHAWKGGANFFATRDRVLLDHADDLRKVTGLVVLRPTDVLARLHGDSLDAGYAPIRLHNTQVERRTVASEQELLPFQRFVDRESKSAWLNRIRSARAAPDRYSVELVGVCGQAPRIAVAVERSRPDSLHFHFLRALSGSLTSTLLRRVIADVVESAQAGQRNKVTIDEPGPGEVREALIDVGFEEGEEGCLVRYTLQGVVTDADVTAWIHARFPEASMGETEPAATLETRFWPLKVVDAGIPSFIIPIRRLWAAELFDRHLAGEELFGVPEGPALALENVYYSASHVSIPEGSRVLWYVSRDVGELRAISTSLGTDTDTATRLSRRYRRLGVYEWQDVLKTAKGNPNENLHAYRFARTELLRRPVSWNRLEDLILRHMGTRNRLASPLRIPESLFEEVYRDSMGEAP